VGDHLFVPSRIMPIGDNADRGINGQHGFTKRQIPVRLFYGCGMADLPVAV
jgi:hypothetical protein